MAALEREHFLRDTAWIVTHDLELCTILQRHESVAVSITGEAQLRESSSTRRRQVDDIALLKVHDLINAGIAELYNECIGTALAP